MEKPGCIFSAKIEGIVCPCRARPHLASGEFRWPPDTVARKQLGGHKGRALQLQNMCPDSYQA